MRPFHQILKYAIPCSDNCHCIRVLNIKDLYRDQFIYNKCFERNQEYSISSSSRFLKRLMKKNKI